MPSGCGSSRINKERNAEDELALSNDFCQEIAKGRTTKVESDMLKC